MQLFRIQIMGALHGIGFRVFVYRLAKRLHLTGFIKNSCGTMIIEVQGRSGRLKKFLRMLENDKPAQASIYAMEYSVHDPKDYKEFKILHTENPGKRSNSLLPDIATCNDCVNDLFDPRSRYYRYPFMSCEHCGPRYSVATATPFERSSSTLQAFSMCPDCQKAHNNSRERHYRALGCCDVCGPHVELWDDEGGAIAKYDDAIIRAAELMREGKIIAVKDTGGFRLLADAGDERAVKEFRQRQRATASLALIFPSLQMVKRNFHVSALEKRLLLSPASPIVLLERKTKSSFLQNVSGGHTYIGVKLPSSPLQHLLMHELNFPMAVASSEMDGNPICIDELEALDRLQQAADAFLVHNLPIARASDDSIVRVVASQEQVLKRAGGYASIPIHMSTPAPAVLAIGSYSNNTIAIRNDKEIFLGQHIGNLDGESAHCALKKSIADMQTIYEVEPESVVCDMDPKYLSKKFASELGNGVIPVPHHYAHVLACMADNDIKDHVLGVSWDAAGRGINGTVGGSEFLLTTMNGFKRMGHFREFNLPKESVDHPHLSAMAILYEIFGDNLFEKKELVPVGDLLIEESYKLKEIFKKRVGLTSCAGMGTMFEAVASIIGLRCHDSYDRPAAILESVIKKNINDIYPFAIEDKNGYVVDWEPMILAIINDTINKVNTGRIAARFHNTLAEAIVYVARKVNEPKVVLTGGCFQNKYLTERTILRLQKHGFKPYWHQRIPPNDQGIPVGQLRNIFYADILKVFTENGKKMGKICMEGVLKNVSLALSPEIKEGDKILICDGASIPTSKDKMKQPDHTFRIINGSAHVNGVGAK